MSRPILISLLSERFRDSLAEPGVRDIQRGEFAVGADEERRRLLADSKRIAAGFGRRVMKRLPPLGIGVKGLQGVFRVERRLFLLERQPLVEFAFELDRDDLQSFFLGELLADLTKFCEVLSRLL